MLLFPHSRMNLNLYEAWGKPQVVKDANLKYRIERKEGKDVKTYLGKGLTWEWSTSRSSGVVRSSARVAELNALVSMLDQLTVREYAT